MKTLIIILAISFCSISSTIAQINKDSNKTTTVKKVVEKGTEVKTKVVAKTEVENEVLKVEGTEKQDQRSKTITNKSQNVEVVKNDVTIDAENQQLRLANEERKRAELAASMEAERQKAALRKQELEAKKARIQQELMERRARLEHRPKGMAKLKTD